MSDPITIVENAIKDALRGVEGVKAVLGPEDLPVRDRDYPAVLVDSGAMSPDYMGTEEGGDRLIGESVQFDVMTVLDAEKKEFREQSRALLFKVRAALAGVHRLPSISHLVEDIRFKGATPQDYQSEKGRQGGHHLAFVVAYLAGESTPDVIISRS